MEFKNKEAKILLLSGKSCSGRDTVADFIKNEYEKKGKLVLKLSFGFYIKEYVKKITDWDGTDENKPRELLSVIGNKLIREKINEYFFVNKLLEDIKVYSYFFDVIVVSDCALEIEIDSVRNKLNNVETIRINRPNFDNGLEEDIKLSKIETDLDNYEYFDYIVNNNADLDVLKEKIHLLIEEVHNES